MSQTAALKAMVATFGDRMAAREIAWAGYKVASKSRTDCTADGNADGEAYWDAVASKAIAICREIDRCDIIVRRKRTA